MIKNLVLQFCIQVFKLKNLLEKITAIYIGIPLIQHLRTKFLSRCEIAIKANTMFTMTVEDLSIRFNHTNKVFKYTIRKKKKGNKRKGRGKGINMVFLSKYIYYLRDLLVSECKKIDSSNPLLSTSLPSPIVS